MLQRMCLTLVGAVALASAALAADKPGEHKTKPVYEVHLHHAGADGKKEMTLDASNPEHAQRLAEEIKHGNVHELKLKEEVSLLALKAEKQFQEQMAQANEKVRQTLEEARRDAATTTEAMIAKARGEIKAARDRMLRELESAKDAALQEIWVKSVELASVMSTKAIRQSVSAETHRRLFDEALAELKAQPKVVTS